MSVLALRDIVAGYGDAPVLHGVSLDLAEGEIVTVIGPNGAGKSTAMKAVFGLAQLHGGQVLLRGRDIARLPAERIVALGVAMAPQTDNVFPNLSVEENLEMGAFLVRGPLGRRFERIWRLFPQLRERRRQAAGLLSGGQRQMVAIGRALMPEPEVLLLDEPTAGLSPAYAEEIFRLVQRINAAGTPVLMVEQNARRALAVSHRGYVLVDGRNRHEGPSADLLQDPETARMFLGG